MAFLAQRQGRPFALFTITYLYIINFLKNLIYEKNLFYPPDGAAGLPAVCL